MVPFEMRQEPSYFDGAEPDLIFVAKKLADAQTLEALLTDSGIDYGVEADEYTGGVVFKTTRIGAFFYVRPEFREAAMNILLANGYVPVRGENAGAE